MARPYMPPADRKRMGPPPVLEDSESPVDDVNEGTPVSPERGDGDTGNPPSVFLEKEVLAGKEYKAGDTLEMKVLAVDPETGEVEVVCAPKSEAPAEAPSVAMMDEMGME